MTTYNYLESVKEDVRNYIEENSIVVTSNNREELEQELNDILFTEDSVTGNASGSYITLYQAISEVLYEIEEEPEEED